VFRGLFIPLFWVLISPFLTLLAQEDLTRLLYLSRVTIQRILAEYRRRGDYIPTRGFYHDIGLAPSHKYQVVRLYLRGLQPTEIAKRLCHDLSSVERYLDDFCRVMVALEAKFLFADQMHDYIIV
jgi:hypothetical protein